MLATVVALLPLILPAQRIRSKYLLWVVVGVMYLQVSMALTLLALFASVPLCPYVSLPLLSTLRCLLLWFFVVFTFFIPDTSDSPSGLHRYVRAEANWSSEPALSSLARLPLVPQALLSLLSGPDSRSTLYQGDGGTGSRDGQGHRDP